LIPVWIDDRTRLLEFLSNPAAATMTRADVIRMVAVGEAQVLELL
jgi:hypothetical protein